MKKYFKKIIILISPVAVLALPYIVSASQAYDNLVKTGEKSTNGSAPYAHADEYKMAEIVGTVIQAFLGLLGIIFLAYLLYAGYNWMTAQGDEEKVTKAKDTIQRAIIGLIIIIGAYAISYFVMDKLVIHGGIIQ